VTLYASNTFNEDTVTEYIDNFSNVMVVDGDGKASRLGSRKNDDGKNVRISRRTGKDI